MALRRSSTHGTARILIALAIVAWIGGPCDAQTQTFRCAATGGFGGEVALIPPVLLSSLKTVPNPVIPKDPVTGNPLVRADLVDYIANLGAAIQLGKALFWDMQAGSDNSTACATCHFQAGADGRTRNLMHPGPNGQWDAAHFGPNVDLWAGAFPFTGAGGDTDNIAGSQGVRKSSFNSVTASGVEVTTPLADPVFNVSGRNVRQLTDKNTPTLINAVFNHRNFFNGRAQSEFNGVNPFGNRDTSARVWVLGTKGKPTTIDIHIQNASLASQAVGPALNSTEMSAAGRSFQELGKKLLRLKPLALQRVDPNDSVLGPIAGATAGLTTTYDALIKKAFNAKWRNHPGTITIGGRAYSMTEANFSLFWGLSIMLYEATLVSDDSPIDQYLMYRATAGAAPNPAVLDDVASQHQADLPGLTRDSILNGLSLFELPPVPAPAPNGVACNACHAGANLTSASVLNMTVGVEPGDANFKKAGFDLRLERMFMKFPPVPAGTDLVTLNTSTWTVSAANMAAGTIVPAPVAVYDTGWYNIGVRPTADDAGLGGADPFGKALSFTRLFQTTLADPSFIKVPGNGLGCGAAILNNNSGVPLLSGSMRKTEANDVAGTFKVPSLRNVELNGPYFHNGGKSTLTQVLQFYDAGGDFANATRSPLIHPLNLDAAQRSALVAFLLALTDERVRWERAPFDHPQLFVPNGANPDATDNVIEIPATGAGGASTPLTRFLNLNPFQQ